MPWGGAAAASPEGLAVLDLGWLLLKLSKNLTHTLCRGSTVYLTLRRTAAVRPPSRRGPHPPHPRRPPPPLHL